MREVVAMKSGIRKVQRDDEVRADNGQTRPLDRDTRQASRRSGKAARKTRFAPQELEEFRQVLLEKRRELVGDVDHLRSEAAQRGSGSSVSDMTSIPSDLADQGTDTWEQTFTFGLIENKWLLLREIDEALQRVENRTYGVCMGTNKMISKARLRVIPWTKYCIDYANELEEIRHG